MNETARQQLPSGPSTLCFNKEDFMKVRMTRDQSCSAVCGCVTWMGRLEFHGRYLLQCKMR